MHSNKSSAQAFTFKDFKQRYSSSLQAYHPIIIKFYQRLKPYCCLITETTTDGTFTLKFNFCFVNSNKIKYLLSFQLAVFIGPILAVVFSIFGFCTRYIDITPMLSWMWYISYFRAAFHGIINTVYGMNRPYLECPENTVLTYCHFKNPKIFLNDMLIPDQTDLVDNIVLMCSVIFTMHLLTAIVLWLKLNKR